MPCGHGPAARKRPLYTFGDTYGKVKVRTQQRFRENLYMNHNQHKKPRKSLLTFGSDCTR